MLKGVGGEQGVKREDRGLKYGEGGGKGWGVGGLVAVPIQLPFTGFFLCSHSCRSYSCFRKRSVGGDFCNTEGERGEVREIPRPCILSVGSLTQEQKLYVPGQDETLNSVCLSLSPFAKIQHRRPPPRDGSRATRNGTASGKDAQSSNATAEDDLRPTTLPVGPVFEVTMTRVMPHPLVRRVSVFEVTMADLSDPCVWQAGV